MSRYRTLAITGSIFFKRDTALKKQEEIMECLKSATHFSWEHNKAKGYAGIVSYSGISSAKAGIIDNIVIVKRVRGSWNTSFNTLGDLYI